MNSVSPFLFARGRQGDEEFASLIQSGFKPDVAVVSFQYSRNNRESESFAAYRSCRVKAVKQFEYIALMFNCYPDTVVFNAVYALTLIRSA